MKITMLALFALLSVSPSVYADDSDDQLVPLNRFEGQGSVMSLEQLNAIVQAEADARPPPRTCRTAP